MEYPPQNKKYLGPITDTTRWENFQHRPDDIFICTPPKCGTTWTQAICALLVFGEVDHGQQTSSISPWVDAAFAPIDVVLPQIDVLPHRRFIKTHTPLDGIPYYPECTYLVVMRDPRDAFFSGQNHSANMSDEELAQSVFPTGPTAFTDWLSRSHADGTWDLQSLTAFVHFFQSYWLHKNLPNVHMHHYSDMKLDLKGVIAKMAQQIGTEISDDLLDDFTEAASFGTMKQKALQFAPEAGTGMWKSESNFFASGISRQWESQLNASDLAAFDTKLAELLPTDEAQWLLNGENL